VLLCFGHTTLAAIVHDSNKPRKALDIGMVTAVLQDYMLSSLVTQPFHSKAVLLMFSNLFD
jgi:hypothetical protein